MEVGGVHTFTLLSFDITQYYYWLLMKYIKNILIIIYLYIILTYYYGMLKLTREMRTHIKKLNTKHL